eukprot:gene6055-7542_t
MVKKVKGTFERSIVVGSISNWLGKKADGHTHTHRWTAYIRGVNNEELPFIKKVVFHLHSSFKNPNRGIEQPPYEIHETGWGEFDLGVTLYFVDNNEKPIELFHILRLHPPEGVKTKQPVVSETLDVLVFTDPSESFYNLIKLPDKPPQLTTNPSLQLSDHALSPQEQIEINKIVEGRTKTIAEIQSYRELCKQKETESLSMYQNIQQLERQKLILQKKLEKYNQMKSNSGSINNNNNNPSTSISTTAATSL